MSAPADNISGSSVGRAGGHSRRPGLDHLLRWRFYPRLFHWLLIAGSAVLVFFAFAPGQKGEGNLATQVVWKLWWPALPFLLLAGGRIWCGLCPFGGLADRGGRITRRSAVPPAWLKRIGPWLGIGSVFLFGLAFLALGLEDNAGATGWILIGMSLAALGFSLFYRGRVFCRYLCPVGMITRVYSFFSWLRPRGGGVKGPAVCPVGQSPQSLRQPSQCHLCGGCTGARQPGGITTAYATSPVRHPQAREFGLAESALSLLLLGLMAADSVRMTPMFARFQQAALPYTGYNYRLTVVLGVAGLVGLLLMLALAFSALARWRIGGDARAFAGLGFNLLPLTLGVFLALALQHLWSGAWPALQTVLVESRLLEWNGHMPPTNVYFFSWPLKAIQLGFLATGLTVSLLLAARSFRPQAAFGGGGNGAFNAITSRAMTLAAASGFGFLFFLPMSGAC